MGRSGVLGLNVTETAEWGGGHRQMAHILALKGHMFKKGGPMNDIF